MDFLHQFRQHCADNQLVQSQDRLLLAVSGGVDSCVMLDLFCQLREQWQLQLAVAHANHQLRGNASDQDEAFVKDLAHQADLPFYSKRVEVAACARAQRLSLETAGRELRYQALENFRESFQARAVVTAHTLDDQAETILDHLLRGCGLAGLAGMAAQNDLCLQGASEIFANDKNVDRSEVVLFSEDQPLKGQLRAQLRTKILRPLLPFSRAQIEEYARSRQLPWREDRTNVDTQFRRNRIRHELLPLIKTRFNPQIARSLEHLANIAVSAENYLQAEAAARLPKVIKERQSDKIILDLELFWKYFPIIQRYVIRAVMQELLRQPAELSFAETARLLALLQQPPAGKVGTGKRYIWHRQIEVRVDHDGAVFEKQKAKGTAWRAVGAKKQKASSLAVATGERCEIAGTEFAILIERKELPRDWREQVNANSQFVDAEKVSGELRVRFPRPGDRFVLLRAKDGAGLEGGSKKLSDFFTDLKVPLHRRPFVPILEGEAIIWICGYRLDNRFKITPATQSVLHLQLLPLNDNGSFARGVAKDIETINRRADDLNKETMDALTYQVPLFEVLEKHRLYDDEVQSRILEAIKAEYLDLQKVNKSLRDKIKQL